MSYIVNLTGNRTSKDGSIMGKVHDFKEEMALHEQSELNVYRKHPQLTACDRRVTVYNRHTQQKSASYYVRIKQLLGCNYLS